jgi:uncharacterized membrane protein
MSLVTRPFAHIAELDEIASRDPHNLASWERTASLVGGSLLAGAAGLLWRHKPALLLGLLGGALVYRGATGHCELYRRLGINSARPHPEPGVRDGEGLKIEASEHVLRPADELYRYWRRLENLPHFMPHLISVEETAEGISRWKVQGPFGRELTWDAEIIEEQPGTMLAWQTLPGAAVASAGSVWFEPEGEGTRVKVSMKYAPPTGKVAGALAAIFGASPAKQIREDLARFKTLTEAEEV